MRINFGALLTFKTEGVDAAAKKSKLIADNFGNAADQADRLNSRLGKTGATAAKKAGAGAWKSEDGITTKENRGAKGVSGQRGAAGRDFAGLRDASDSTSGIVAAYATAAANMFAITAAFKALADAAKVEQLREGLKLVGAQSGVTLSLVSKNLEKVTGYGISAAEAMKSVASATAAGFSGKEIERLGAVARGAAVALGRDMSDAMDRLTRGSIKLEPELLDELGIMTRIDDAVTSYANAHNKAKSSLTQTERRQAFLNAVLAEGEDKFNAIAEQVAISPFDKLNASLKNMATDGLGEVIRFLDPLVKLLADMPQLILLPLAGVFQSVVGKLIPGASQALETMERKAKTSGKALEASLSNKGFRTDAIASSVGSARRRATEKLGMSVSDDHTLPYLTKERDAVKKLTEEKIKHLATIEKTTAAQKAQAAAIERQIQAGQASLAAYNQAINLTNADKKFHTNVAKKDQQFRLNDTGARAFDRTQTLIASREGDGLGQMSAGLKGIRAQWAAAGASVLAYRAHVAAANADTVGGTAKVGALTLAWASARAAAFAFGTTVKLIGQGLMSLIPIIGWIMLAWTAVTVALDFFKSDKQKGLDDYKNKIKDILDTAFKVTQQVEMFNTAGKYGRAFEAELGNIIELNEALKERALLEKDGYVYKTKAVDVKQRLATNANLSDEDKEAVDIILSRIEKFKAPAEFKKFSGQAITLFNTGKIKEAYDLIDKTAKPLEKISKSWTNIAESSKAGGDAIRKFNGEDFFKTDYTAAANSYKEFVLEIGNQTSLIGNRDSLEKAAASSVDALTKGGKEYFVEMDRLAGGTTKVYEAAYATISGFKEQMSALEGKTDKESIADFEKARVGLVKASLELQGQFMKDGIAAKAALFSLDVKTREIQATVAKAQQSLQEAKNTVRSLEASIAKSERSLAVNAALNGRELSKGWALSEAKQAAKINLDNVQALAKFKAATLTAEYNLLDAQKRFEYIKARNAHNSETAIYNRFIADQKSKPISYGKPGDTYSSVEAAEADKAKLTAQYNLLMLMKDNLDTGGGLLRQNLLIIDRGIKEAEVGLRTAEQAQQLYATGDQRRVETAKTLEEYEKRTLDLKMQGLDSALELEELIATNRAAGARGNLGQGLTKDVQLDFQQKNLQNTLEKAKLQETQRSLEATRQQAELQQQITDKTIEMLENPDALFIADATADQAALIDTLNKAKSTEIGAIALSVAAQALITEKLNGLALEIQRLPLAAAIEDRLQAGRDNLDLQRASIGANMGGYGKEFQEGLQVEVANNKDYTQSGMAGLLANPKAIAQIREASFALAQMNVIAEGTANIASAFHDQMAGAFSAIIDGSKDAGEAFGDMALSMLKMIGDLIAQLIAMQVIKAAAGIPGLGFLSPAAAGGIMPMATGGIMSRSAGGVEGVIKKPTYLVGEGRYNEAVVPLPNGRAIPVQMHGNNTSSNSVQVNVHMGQNGETKTDSKGPDMNNLGAAIASAVQKELLAQKAPGGILSKYGAA